MNNLFKCLAAGAVALVVSTGSADTLYWQVTSDAGKTFDYASLMVTGGSLSNPVEVDSFESDGESPSSTGGVMLSDISAYASTEYSFYVEMLNYNETDGWTSQGTGSTYTYDQLVSSGYVATGLIDATTAMANAATSNFGSSGAIPEPSSGLLLLIGGAMLALRRRRQK